MPTRHLTLVAALLLAPAAHHPALAATLRLDARALFDLAVTRNLTLSQDGSALELISGEVYQDDGPAAGWSYRPNEEKLGPGIRARKQLVISDPRAASAVLMVGPGGRIQAAVNGRVQKLEPPRPTGFGQWQCYTINPADLKPGINDIDIFGRGKLWIARADDAPAPLARRSARSTDDGATWQADRLGPAGDISGEYYVRIFLERYRPQGSLVLPVMDLGNLEGGPLAPPLSAPGPVRISVGADLAGGSVATRVRSGITYVPRSGTWSEWTSLSPGGVLRDPRGRYIQVEVTLATADPLATPLLREIAIESASIAAPDWTRRARVLDARNERIVRTSIPFLYEPYTHPRLQELRRRYGLDEMVKDARSDFEIVTRLSRWTTRLWKWGAWHLDKFYPAWDALEILGQAPDGTRVGGFCLQYDVVLLQACESFGIPGRVVSISRGTLGEPKVGGHEPTEFWSNEYRKWVYVDGNNSWYAVDEATGVPLSLWELRKRQIRAVRRQPYEPVRIFELELGVQPWRWRSLTEDVGFAELRLIPRSNFLEQKTPLPLNQGYMRAWFWDGHHVWTDRDAPAELLHPNLVTQPNNFQWTLNQAHYALEPGARTGELRVHLDTETPGFETFLAEVDGGAPRRVEAVFDWKLHPGRNRLKVWPRNNAGRDGIPSWIEIEMPRAL